jgi:uncharacterized peroxidase-related enzyme
MTFVHTIADEDATGAVRDIYDADRTPAGQVPNYTQAFSARPNVYAAWKALNGQLKAGMDVRRYELVTIAAARRLRSTYCMVAHGSVLLNQGVLDADELGAVVADHGSAGLDAVDVAVMDLADMVAADATAVTQHDVDRLRDLGLGDTEIFDVVAAAAMRCFFSKVLDGLGALADPRFGDLEPELRAALTVGRPIDDGAPAPGARP